ncbi:MAG: hypothetical protein WC139_07020 [Candidatus Kapaibacterium sp.]
MFSYEWLFTSLILIGINFGIIRTQLKNKVDRSEVRDLVDSVMNKHLEKCPMIKESYSAVNGAILETEIKNIKKSLDEVKGDVKTILSELRQN